MIRFAVTTLLLAAVALMVAGCGGPPERWRHQDRRVNSGIYFRDAFGECWYITATSGKYTSFYHMQDVSCQVRRTEVP